MLLLTLPSSQKNDESDSITDDENDNDISEESETDNCHSIIVDIARFLYHEEKYQPSFLAV